MELNKIKAILFPILLLLISCEGREEENLELKILFNSIENNIGSELLLAEFKTLPKDSLYFISHLFSIGINAQKEEDVAEFKYQEVIDSLIESLNWEIREEVLMYAFQEFLNHREFKIATLQSQVKKQIEKRRSQFKKEEELEKRELMKIIEKNDLKQHVGDTMSLSFQLDSKDGYKTIFYNKYPASMDFSYADDTLEMKGVLLKKYYVRNFSSYKGEESNKYLDLIFKLKILELNKEVNYFGGGRIKEGDEFKLYLEAYGLEIK